jgi:hypothetical protein
MYYIALSLGRVERISPVSPLPALTFYFVIQIALITSLKERNEMAAISDGGPRR